jgi:hypothetical protein
MGKSYLFFPRPEGIISVHSNSRHPVAPCNVFIKDIRFYEPLD